MVSNSFKTSSNLRLNVTRLVILHRPSPSQRCDFVSATKPSEYKLFPFVRVSAVGGGAVRIVLRHGRVEDDGVLVGCAGYKRLALPRRAGEAWGSSVLWWDA